MKTTVTKNKFSLRLALLIVICSLFIVLSCEQPFKAGLGPIIDLQPPTGEITFPKTGAYIRGVKDFYGKAKDDTQVASVLFRISEPSDIVLPGYRTETHYGQVFHKININSGREVSFSFTIDTKMMIDAVDSDGNIIYESDGTPKKARAFAEGGKIILQLLVIDSNKRDNTTDGKLGTYGYFVKNDGPQISMTTPQIEGGAESGFLGGDLLNYGYINDQDKLSSKPPFPRVMDTEGLMVGLIEDSQDINYYERKAASGDSPELFPPQIRFWQVDLELNYKDDPENHSPYWPDHIYPPGVIPDFDKEPWVDLDMVDKDAVARLLPSGKTATLLYQLPKVSGTYYAFQIRAQSTDELKSTIYYPQDYVQNYDHVNDVWISEKVKEENSYALIRVQESSENPKLELYALQDIYGVPREGVMTYLDSSPTANRPVRKDAGITEYNILSEIDAQMEKDGNHVYVDKPVVTKGGAFTLRMKATHSGGIKNAKVYWEKNDDKSVRGRFIWDPVNEKPKGWGENGAPEWLANVVPASDPYEEWGRNEWDGRIAVRSFVFTYKDIPSQDRIPNDSAYNSLVRGKPKVQKYTGSLSFEELEAVTDGSEDSNWADMPVQDGHELPEGTYNISVYTRSKSLSRVALPYTVTISIDRRPPSIGLNYIDGSAEEKVIDSEMLNKLPADEKATLKVDERYNIVNGVIRPRFLISESEPADSSFRPGNTEFFEKSPGSKTYYTEQAYMLVPIDQVKNLNDYLSAQKNIWPFEEGMITPDTSVSAGSNYYYTITLPGSGEKLKISKTGPIFNLQCRIRTSPIYNDPTSETDYLPDGKYRLYAFARDKAFNVGRCDYPIEVDHTTDWPIFDWSVGRIDTGVTEPDASYDFGNKYNNEVKSFITDGIDTDPIRNKFTGTSNIRVRIKDDDSLDLGEGPGVALGALTASKIKVTLIGSKPDGTGVVKALTPETDYLLTLGDTAVKEAFTAQSTYSGYDEENNNAPKTLRRAVKEVTGVISQKMLLDLLKNEGTGKYDDSGVGKVNIFPGGKDGYNSLPDGIYRVGIHIEDYNDPSVKLRMFNPDNASIKDPNPADRAYPSDVTAADNYTKYFWIAVDSKSPKVEFVYPDSNIFDPTKTSYLEGTVSDENGPITLVGWRIFGGTKTQEWTIDGPDNLDPLLPEVYQTTNWVSQSYNGSKWVYEFKYAVDLKNNPGSFTFELTFQDRFGNKSSQSLKYVVDDEAPKVSLTKLIETFQRNFDDVYLDPHKQMFKDTEYVVKNKNRLAVKVVTFTINATDNNKVKGVRWWLLPADTGSEKDGIDFVTNNADPTISGGIVKDYNAYPSQNPLYSSAGTYYPGTGAYGVIDMAGRQFTTAVNTESMTPQNGEYRLHIIAIDEANNQSSYTYTYSYSSSSPDVKLKNVFQEVFFLQEEDKPYIPSDKTAITPGVFSKESAWPTMDDDVLGGVPVIRGTIYENNGFFSDKDQSGFWNGSISIWFSADGDDLPADLTALENLIKNDGNIPGYGLPKKVPDDLPNKGLGKQGKNISLAIPLTDLFPDALKTDGHKRYIIKATDSPVNKYKELPFAAGTALGTPATPTENEAVREYRWASYSFIYDALPPEVEITKPLDDGTAKFGKNFNDNLEGFILEGYIFDENLATYTYKDPITGKDIDTGDYYFEYYLDSDTASRRVFILGKTVGTYITKMEHGDDPSKTAKVTFSIPAKTVAAEIIPNFFEDKTLTLNDKNILLKALSEGQHTLNIFAFDKSGKEGADWVTFEKDMKPPTIAFTNLASKPYDSTNASRVDDKLPKNSVDGWWNKTAAQRQKFVLGDDGTPPLPLTTLYYDNGVPELRGTITDAVSNIALSVIKTDPISNTLIGHDGITSISAASVGTGEINTSDSSFQYWIDNDPKPRYLAVIDGNPGRSIRWTINLTQDGTLNTAPLPDGVHTIRLTASDTAKITIPGTGDPDGRPDEQYIIAFRIDSKNPKSYVTVTGMTDGAVYGNAAQQDATMFTLNLTAGDANLDRVELKIVRKATKDGDKDDETLIPPFTARNSSTWTYYPYDTKPWGITFPPGFSPPASDADGDYILYNGTYGVARFAPTVLSGKYEAIVTAYDTANNKSEEYVFHFTYDKDAPVIEFTNPDKTNATGTDDTLKPEHFIDIPLLPELTDKNNINRLTSESLRIQGNVIDALSPVKEVWSKVWKWNWLTGAWEVKEEWAQMKDYLNNKDNYSTNTQTQVAWTKYLLGQNGDLDLRSGTPGLPITTESLKTAEGLYRIQIRAKDASSVTYPGGEWDTVNPPTANPGNGNPVISEYAYFYFDRTDPELVLGDINGVPENATHFPKPSDGFTFEGTVTDNNRFAKVEVKFESVLGTINIPVKNAILSSNVTPPNAADPAPNINQGGSTQKWRAVFDNKDDFVDGRYKVTVTVYDMTGRSAKKERSFTLDSTAPYAKFTLPAKVVDKGYGDDTENPKPVNVPENTLNGFASVIVNGGETSVITGETGDKPGPNGEKGSESGIRQMWFRLGYIDGSNEFPTKTAVRNDANNLITTASGLNPGKTNNELMDIVAETTGTGTLANAWFKLGGTQRPTGFIINNPNIYDWRMEIPDILPVSHPDIAITGTAQIGGLKLYCSPITVKGREYTVGSGTLQMVRPVDGQAGIYRLPLWIRLVDGAGNVEYYCHDIWIYPDGDVPWTTIENPSNGALAKARGGTISVDGVAHSNTSVYAVIFRVFADAEENTDLDGATHRVGANPGDASYNHAANYVKIIGYDTVTDTEILARIPNGNPPGGTYPAPDGRTTNYRTTDWQMASLTMPGGSGEPIIPWNIMLNSEDQIRKLIDTRGFPVSARANIRVWLEVFVFNGTSSPIRSSVYADDKLSTGSGAGGPLYGNAVNRPPYYLAATATAAADKAGPRPYVRSFYLKTAAPQITHPNVGTWNSPEKPNDFNYPEEHVNLFNPSLDYGYKGVGTETRRQRFSVKAILDPRGSTGQGNPLGEVAYRMKVDGGAYGTWNTVWKDGSMLSGNPGIRITERTESGLAPPRLRHDFVYALNSQSGTSDTVSGVTFAGLNDGKWADSGGTMTVQVRIRDTASPPNEADYSIQVSVDNFAPIADPKYITSGKVAGSNVDFFGRAYDYATTPPITTEYTPRKLERVYAWFEKVPPSGGSRQFVHMTAGTLAAPSSSNSRTMTNVFDGVTDGTGRSATIAGGNASDTVTSITLDRVGGTRTVTYPLRTGTEEKYNAAYIREIDQASGQPVNKMLWSPVNSADYDVRWSFNLDTTNLPDGDLVLCYIVVDKAGNATYYEQKTSVRNKYPEINRVTLYTNNIGQGAAYTAPASADYSLNDYRSKMFANYTDPADYPAIAGKSYSKIDQLGYLNSGFISKNQYIGFQVETVKGNRPLNFRLQHVTRQRIQLSKATLTTMVANKTTGINLYTIAWHGNYNSTRWRAIGVPIDNPQLGTHFVFSMTPEELAAYPDDPVIPPAAGTLPEVWQYTVVGTLTKTTPSPTVPNNQVNGTGSVVFGNGDPSPEARFEFRGTGDFNTGTGTDAAKIRSYDGSHPDADDKKDDNPNSASPGGTAFFLIRVWDTVNNNNAPPSETWVNDQLYDALVVGMNVYLTDTEKPVSRLYDLNPYTEISVTGNNSGTGNQNATVRNAADPTAIGSNIVRGGLYNTGSSERALVKSGYVDPRTGSTALTPVNSNGIQLPDYPLKVLTDTIANPTTNGRDQVSGKVILRGIAWDDQLIDTISLNLGGLSKTILELDTTTGKMTAAAGGIVNGQTRAFAVETLHWKTGHTVEWAYVWDTEAEPAGRNGGFPLTDRTVTATVKDRNSSGLTSDPVALAAENGTTIFHNTVNVDIVPYITGFERETPTFATKRSLQGWYSFYQGEANIALIGYNLGRTAGSSGVQVYLNSTGAAGNGMEITGGAFGGAAVLPENIRNRFAFTMPTSAASGRLQVTVSGTAAYNHTSNTTNSWNKESNTYTPGSTLWNNKPHAHIWRTTQQDSPLRTYIGTVSGDGSSAGLDHPGMALEYTGSAAGTLHGTWAVYGKANTVYGRSDGTGNLMYQATPGEPYGSPDISIFQGGGASAANVALVHQTDGRPRLVIKALVSQTSDNGTPTGQTQIFDGGTAVGTTERWQNIRLSKADQNASGTTNDVNNVGRIYMTAFNADTKGLWFGMRNGTVNTAMWIDGNVAANSLGINDITPASGSIAKSTNAGEYSAVDYDNIGPIVAYYDGNTVRIAFGTSATPGAGNWTRRYLLPADHPLYTGSGQHISIKVDRQNGIHLAFYNSARTTVVYYYASGRAQFNAGTPVPDTPATPNPNVRAHIIDNVVTGGIRTDISVYDDGTRILPWIVYGDSSRTDNYDGVRVAYRSGTGTGVQFNGALFCPATGAEITGWEALTMPAQYTVKNDRLNIEAWPPTYRQGGATPSGSSPGWNAAIGYAGSSNGVDMFRVGYFIYPQWKGY